MIISTNYKPTTPEFVTLLADTLTDLEATAIKKPDYFLARGGNKLEEDVQAAMSSSATGGPFEGSIELISGSKFPDIVAKKYFGVEVKTTKQNHWTTTGNSVLESTRVPEVERIYILFGKLVDPIQFKCRPYEQCLRGVGVTHWPRYLIDMELEQGETIPEKMGMTYDELRKQPNPVRPIIDYYRENLAPGQDLWWIDSGSTEEDEDSSTSSVIIKFWPTLTKDEQLRFRNQGMALFPQIFGTDQYKYYQFASWLATRHGVISASLRDIFTAGGTTTLTVNGVQIERVPQIFYKLQNNVKFVVEELPNFSLSNLSRYWDRPVISSHNLVEQWLDLVVEHAAPTLDKHSHSHPLDVREMILEQIG